MIPAADICLAAGKQGIYFIFLINRKMEEQVMKEYSKWKSGKRFLTAAVTLSLLGSLGLYSPAAYAEEDFEEYTGSITGKEDNASEYVMAHITKDGGKNYKFTDDSLIKTNQGVKVGDLDYPVNIDASGHVLKFYGHVNDKHTLVHAVEANSKKGVTITAKKLIIDAGNTKSRAEGISVGGQNGTNKDAPYRLTINGDTDIRAHGDTYGLGMYLCGNAEVTVNGNVTMNTHDEKNPWAVYVEKDGGLSYYGGSAIYAGNNYKLQLGPKLTINGLVDLKVNANGAFANGGHSDIYLRGGNIEINKDNTKGYYALLAECATTTMNMERDENKVPVRAGSAKVTIKGNIGASAGAINVNEPETYSRTNLGLATPDSSWTGIAYNAFKDEGNEVSGTLYGSDEIIKKTFFGEINLWLQNGASWTNEAWGEPPDAYYGEDFSESHLKRLVGGESADKAGHIFQKPGEDEDSEGINIRVDDYKGFTNVYYGHKDEKPTDILGGTFTVTKAQPGSGITLITDSKGLNVDSSKAADKNLASATLNALANKLFYTAYKNGETNLAGKVEIAEGLTSSSLSKRMEDITFKESNGQGQYLYTPAEDESGQTVTEFGRAITGGTDQLYVDAGVKQADGTYKFTKDSTITIEDTVLGETYPVNTDGGNKVIIDAEGKKLTLVSKGKGLRAGIQTVLKDNKKIDITADKLIINAENTAGMSRAYGIWFSGNSSILDIHGDTKITSKANDWSYGVLLGQASKANFDGLKVSVSKEAKESAALKGTGKSVISVNVQGDTAGSNSVQLDGEVVTKYLYEEDEDGIVTTDGPSTINLALTTSDSYWNGLSAYSYKDENDGDTITKEDHGNLNLWLQNGGVWTNEKYGKTNYAGFKGSYATRLTGGSDASHAGIIIQKDEKPISVENYSGHTTVIYEHDTAAPADPNEGFVIKGGDFKIAKAAAGSGITMRTGSKGLDTDSVKAKDKNLVNATLNALANKLFYTEFKDGKTNLTGKVEIAEGLTTSAVAKKLGDISFKSGTGQGEYIYTPEEDPIGEIIDAEGPITFNYKKDSKVFGSAVSQIGGNSKNLAYNFAGKTVNITTGGSDWAPIGMTPNVKAVINAKQLNLKTPEAGMMGTYGIYLEDGDDITVNSDVNMTVNGGAYMVDGIFMGHMGAAEAAKTKLTINGNVTMRGTGNDQSSDDFWGIKGTGEDGGYPTYMGSRWAPEGIYLGKEGGSSITINGNVDMAVKGNGAVTDAYYKVAGQNSLDNVLTLNGDVNIITPKNTERGFLALGAFGGTVNVNVKTETEAGGKVKVTGASDHKVNLVGNLYASKDDGNGDNTYYFRDGAINLGLTTSDSTWSGVVSNTNKNTPTGKSQQGDINLWLQNGATWNHEAVSRADAVYAAGNNGKTTLPSPSNGLYGAYDGISHLTTLTGGKDADHAGLIAMKDKADVEVGTYSGFSRIYYNHENSTPKQMIGGDFKVSKALDGSRITLMTGSNGLDTSSTKAADKNLVSETLNALAGKLYYLAKDGKLSAKAALAEGLTASEASLDLKNVTFKESNGQGQYLYTPASDIPDEQTETAFTDTITGVKAKDMKYVNTGVRKEDGTYKFTKDSEITIAAGGPAVNVEEDVIIRADGKTLKMKTVEGSGTVYGINQSTAKKAEITAKNLDVEVTSTSRAEGIHMANSNAAIRPEMTINGNVNLKVSGTANTLGAYIQGNSRLTVNGNVTADVDGHNGGFSYYGATGLYSTSNMGPNSMGADITVNGNVDLKGKAHGIFANAGGSKVTVNGGGSIEVDKASTNPYAAIRAEDGVVNMNVKLDSNGNAVGSLDKKVNIKGNLAVTTGAVNAVDKKGTLSQINLGLTTSDSTLEGVVYNAFPDEGKKAGELTFKGEANLFLANGAAWTNEKYIDTGTSWGGKNFEGSHLTRLAGGASADKAGQIFQKDTGNITVDNYSGYTDVYYAHEETAPKTMIGGDFIIRKASSGSGISLITDNKGLNTSSDKAADKNLVSETLNALANKLFYKAYADGENNLTGFVKIAEGLTSSEAVLKTGDITFKNDNGQGRYLYTPATDQLVGPITTSEDINVTRKAEADGSVRIVWTEPNAVSGKYVSTLYSENSTSKQNPMVVDLNGHNLDLKANSAGKIAAAVYVGNNQYIHINSGVNDKLVIEATNTDTRGSNGIFLEGNSHLNIKGNVEISNVVTKGDAAAGIAFQGKDSEAVIDGTLKITDVYGKRGRGAGINASGIAVTGEKSKMTVTGPVSISGVKGSGLKTVGADTTISVGGGTIEAAEDADKSHNYYAARVEKGTININMDGDQAGKTKTNITGDMFVTGQYGKKVIEYSGGQLVDWKNAGKLNVALTDDQSSWKGAAVYDQYTSDYGTGGKTVHDVGEFNLWLQNGAVWTNERQSHGTTTTTGSAAFIGSQIAHFHGDNGDAKKSVIYQKDENPIFVNTYSGKSTIIYEHDTTAPTDPNEGFAIKGGDFKITNAAAGSDIVLRTNNAGLNTASDKAADKNLVSGTLNKLANKLYYAAYTKGEKNLSGKVEIAEGLTAQSVSMKIGDITYKDADGQGQYLYTPAEDEPVGGPIKTPEVFTQDRVAKATIADAVGSYTKKFVAAAYNSTSEKDMLVDMKGYALTLFADAGDEIVKTAGIMADGKNLNFINGKDGTPIHITARSAGEGAGIMTRSKGTVSIAHDIVIDKVEGAQMAAGVKTTNPGDKISIKSLKIDQSVKATKDTMQQGAVGINAGGNGAVVEVSDKVDINLKGIGVKTVGGTARIAGGRIVTDTDTTKYHKALVSENSLSGDSSISMNMNEDNTAAGNQKVEILGDIKTQKSKKTGGKTGRVFLGLNSAESSWKGITDYVDDKDYGSGEVNLWLGNSATWTHEKTAATGKHLSSSVWNGSRISALYGGSDTAHAGVIIQKEKNPISVENYSGHTMVIYDHDTTVPTDPNEGLAIKGGDFKIGKAAAGSSIILRTNNAGLDTSSAKAVDKNIASGTLNKLANKLYYEAYTKGEKNLSGKVEIAEGLTASSLSKRIEDVTFKESNGQGQYLYTPASDIPDEQTETAFTDTITGVKAKDMKYVNTGVRKEDGTYKFTKDSEITIAAGGPAVNVEEDVIIRADGKTLKMKTVEGSGTVYGINQSTAKKAEITAKNLDVEVTSTSRAEGIHMANSNAAIRPEMTINGNVNLKVSGTANTLGAYIQGNSRLTVNGNVTADVDGHNGGFSYYGATGLYSTSNMGPNSMGADITVNGNVDLKGKAHGIFANAGGSKVTVNGGGSIEVDKASTNPYAAIRAEDGVVNMNVKLDSNGNAVGSLDKKVNIKGNLAVTTGAVNAVDKKGTLSQINLGLTTSDSTLEGVVYNAFPDEGKKAGELTFKGEANLFLANGAAWTNEKYIDTGTSWGGKNFEGSHLTRLAGGASADKAGQIFQKDTGNITVDNYSGYTDVYYAHEETAPKTMIGGDFIIRKASSGSGISLITDNKGLNTSSDKAADKNLVSETLNALANKLFYKAYADGENNLTGFVKIAEGLTSSEAVLKTGNITFKKDNGQGQYLYETSYPNEQITDPINKTIDGSAASEQAYKEAGVYKSDTDTYKFTKNPATINGDSGAAVDAGTKDIHVDSGENTLNLNGGNTGVGVKAEGGKTADIKGNANITGQTGVLADGAGSKVLLSGNSNITAGGDGIVASGGGTVEAAGITNVTAGAGGKAVRAGGGSSVSLQNGKLKGDVEADNGTVSLHGAETEGNATAAAGGSINLTGGSVAGQVTAKDGNSQAIIKNATVKDLIGSHGGTASITGGIVTGTVSADDGTVKAESTKVNESVNAKNGGTVELKQGSAGRLASEGGRITANGTAVKGDASANAGGTVEMTGGSVGGNTTADNGTIETENTDVANGASALNGGKLKLRNGTVSGGIKTDAASASDVVMDRVGASLQGDVSGEGKTNVTLSNGGNWKGNSAGSGETKVKVGSGGTWTGASMNGDTDVDLEGKWKQTNNSKVRKLISNNGVLDKTAPESGNTDIGQLSGSLSLIYAHDKTNPTKVLGGGTFIAAADAGSTVDMITDNAGLDTNSKKAADKNRVSEALNALAGKLQYTGYQNGERNLKGKLRIAEGLTSSSAGLKTEALSFKRDGQGYFDYTPAKPDKPEIETGDYETSIMSSTRSALTSSILVWRNDMNDMYKRMGDLRIGAESGLWARAYGGRISYDANNAYMKDSYWAAQVGMDKRLASGWHVGGAFGYTDGSATYRYGGKGDPKLYTLAAYATRVSEDGQYVDIIAKVGKLSNKFTAYNKYSAPALRNYVEGKYDTYGYGISAEYGKKIRMGKGFVTPQAELTWSRLSSDSFAAAAPSGESMRVNQSSVNSLIGRLGVVAGVESDKGNFYAKASLFHEFDGDGHILFSEPGKTGKRSSFSLKDTWAEIALGGNYYLSPRSMIYADFTKSFGGDYKVDWRINAGIRFSF